MERKGKEEDEDKGRLKASCNDIRELKWSWECIEIENVWVMSFSNDIFRIYFLFFPIRKYLSCGGK